MKQAILDNISIFLLRKGFTIKSMTHTCFDIIARSSSMVLLIKVLEDANSIKKDFTDEMEHISSYINASPLIIAEKAGSNLENNVVYSRFGIYTLNLATFRNCINNHFPFVKRTQAGLTACILGKKLKQKREQEGYSINELSKKLGVSSRMVVKYENNDSEIRIEKAIRLYNILGDEVFDKIKIFDSETSLYNQGKSDISKKYCNLGFKSLETKKVPFDIISKKDKDVILTGIGDKTNPKFGSLSRLLDVDNLIIFKKKRPKNIPSLTKEEFLDFEKSHELIKFLKEFD
ncbi:MAG: helix-turn-helix domain-containing protein [Nanoarchaeota archaeon]|nr:helix-turn-helix domain-containing protein [Nanoarchaeota archaeon]